MTPESMPFSELMRIRILAHVQIRDTSLAALSKDLGKAHSYLGRKLQPSKTGEKRELSTVEIDEVLRGLHLHQEALFVPAFGPSDREILGWFARTPAAERTELAAAHIYAGVSRAVERLTMQGLLARDVDGTLAVTGEGSRYLPN